MIQRQGIMVLDDLPEEALSSFNSACLYTMSFLKGLLHQFNLVPGIDHPLGTLATVLPGFPLGLLYESVEKNYIRNKHLVAEIIAF